MPKQAKVSAPENISAEHVEEVRQIFNKKFQYACNLTKQTHEHHPMALGGNDSHVNIKDLFRVEDWFSVSSQTSLAIAAELDPELMKLKEEMNSVKDQLSNKDIETWHAHTTRCNLAANVIPHVKSLEVELCTQAWVKFYEILSSFNSQGLVPDQPFLSVHLCEAPGAFVTALNHFLQQKGFQHMWDWRATTLNPYHESNSLGEMIADDRLIRQTYIQWYFGKDGSGDITYPGHVKGLKEMLMQAVENEALDVRMVTADGSKDCQANPAEQESLVSRLHHCEALTAALILAEGGSFVIKLFTMFEMSSVLLVFLLNLMFDKVHTVKPATSKSGNSEVYLVCLGYRKNVDETTLWKMLDLTVYSERDGKMLTLIQPLPQDFIEQHRQCCQIFSKFQLDTIHTNLQLYKNMSHEQTQQLELKQRLVLDLYLQKCGLTASSRRRQIRWVAGYGRDKSAFFFKQTACLEPNLVIPPPPYCPSSPCSINHKSASNVPGLRHCGTFQLRQNLCNLTWLERIKQMEQKDASQPKLTEMQSRGPLQDSELDEVTDVDTGQAFMAILNSRLCDVSYLNDLNLMLENSDYERCRQWHFMDHARWIGQAAAQLLISSIELSQLPQSVGSMFLKPANSCQILYWNRGKVEGEVENSPLYLTFHQAFPDPSKVAVVSNKRGMEITPGTPALVFCNLTSFSDTSFKSAWNSRFDELLCRAKFVLELTAILKVLTPGSHLVVLMPTLLTRLTASLVYILARSFGSIKMESSPNLWLHQLIQLHNYKGVGPDLLSHLEEISKHLQHEVDSQQTQACLMEVLSFPAIACDRKFVQFVTAHNNRCIAGFLNIMLEHSMEVHNLKGR